MGLTLTESAKLSQNDLQRGVIETIIEDSPLVQMLPFQEVSGNAYAYVRENAAPSAAFRAVGSGYTEGTGTFTEVTESLKVLGGDADVDRFIVQTRPGVVADQRAEQTRMKSKAVRMTFQNCFINGDAAVDVNAFDGLKDRLTGSQLIAAGTTGTSAAGLPIVGSDDDDRHAFFDKLDELAAAVQGGPSVYLMNAAVLSKVRSSARRLTIYDETKDAFGKPIMTYNGVPLVDIGFASNGSTLIIPQTENYGTPTGEVYPVTNASSIYAVRFAEGEGDAGVTGLTNGGVQVYDLGEVHDKPVYRTRIEFYCAIALHNVKGAARLEGVLAS